MCINGIPLVQSDGVPDANVYINGFLMELNPSNNPCDIAILVDMVKHLHFAVDWISSIQLTHNPFVNEGGSLGCGRVHLPVHASTASVRNSRKYAVIVSL